MNYENRSNGQVTKTALITGITGQDGSYLAEFLLEKGYHVHGIIRRSSSFNTDRINHLFVDPHHNWVPIKLHYGDLSDGSSLRRILDQVKPNEVYNLAAQSHVAVSFQQPEFTADVCGLGCLRLLEAIREFQDRSGQDVHFYQASSSEMFGSALPPQSELTRFHPRSPYAVAKVYAFWQTVNYREAYNLFACNGILFNHESERRLETFVTRKITRTAARIKLGLESKIYLGNLDARRDWGYAADYVKAMWLMLQQKKADDYVIATGESRSVRDFLEGVFNYLDLVVEDHLMIDPRYIRPAEVDHLEGDPSKARSDLGWTPDVSFDQMVQRMIEHDLKLANQELLLRKKGFAGPVLGSSGVVRPKSVGNS